MAHTCPDCGMLCYCGGDIDDCEFDGTPEQARCGHCADKPDDDERDDEPLDEPSASAPNTPGERPLADSGTRRSQKTL